MATIEERKVKLERQMVEAEKQEQWRSLAELALQAEALDPNWFEAFCFLQAAAVELELQARPMDPYAQLAARANRRVRVLADAKAA